MTDKCRNSNGTFDGIKMLAEISGLSEDEIKWIAQRMHALLAEGKSHEEAIETIKIEGELEPWRIT